MRPKKRVRLIDANPESRSVISTVLRTTGFEISEIDPDVIVTRQWSANLPKDVPVLIYTESRAEFLAAIKGICEKKRGPKKGFKHHFPKVAAVA